MKKKFTLMLLIVIVTVIGLSTVYAVDEVNKTTLSIQAEQPVTVGEMVNIIKTTHFLKIMIQIP